MKNRMSFKEDATSSTNFSNLMRVFHWQIPSNNHPASRTCNEIHENVKRNTIEMKLNEIKCTNEWMFLQLGAQSYFCFLSLFNVFSKWHSAFSFSLFPFICWIHFMFYFISFPLSTEWYCWYRCSFSLPNSRTYLFRNLQLLFAGI